MSGGVACLQAAKLGAVEHQLGLFHAWRSLEAHLGCASASHKELTRRLTLRKTSLSQAHKYLLEAQAWTSRAAEARRSAAAAAAAAATAAAAAGGMAGSPGRTSSLPRQQHEHTTTTTTTGAGGAAAAGAGGTADHTYSPPTANLATLRKYLGSQLDAVAAAPSAVGPGLAPSAHTEPTCTERAFETPGGGGGGGAAAGGFGSGSMAKELRSIIQLSVRISVEEAGISAGGHDQTGQGLSQRRLEQGLRSTLRE